MEFLEQLPFFFMNITLQIESFLNSRKYKDRYTSFDFCYSYFYSFHKGDHIKDIANDKNMEHSCLHIWFYLASWWMMRWSSFLLQKSLGIIKDLIIEISELDTNIWEIDIDSYTDENIDEILRVYDLIEEVFIKNWYKPTETLITKIMLWIFWNIPAFDRYFRKWFDIHSVNKRNLKKIYIFYTENKVEIDSFQIKCYDFLTEENNSIQYTKAKIIDMYGFSIWFNLKK